MSWSWLPGLAYDLAPIVAAKWRIPEAGERGAHSDSFFCHFCGSQCTPFSIEICT
jgi:hypothetical protein